MFLFLCGLFAVNCEMVVKEDTMYWAGGPKHGLDESAAFCESVSHGLIPVLWTKEIRHLEYGLLEQTGEEFWIGAKQQDGKWVWGEGSRIDDFMWEGDTTCKSERCGVTVQSGNHGIRLMVQDVKNKYRNLCRFWVATGSDQILRLARLWKYLETKDKVKLSKFLPSQMIRVNSQRLQDLEQKVTELVDKITARAAE